MNTNYTMTNPNISIMKTTMTWMLLSAFLFTVTSCDSDDEEGPAGPTTPPAPTAVDMTTIDFQPNTLYEVNADWQVPEGESVTIPAGVTLEFQEGPNGEGWFIEVFGSLYIMGEEGNRVTLTASQDLINSSKNQGFGQLWGGVIGTNVAGDLVITHTDILHAGAACREENAMAQPVTGGGGELSAGDASYAIYYIRQNGERQDGIFVLEHSKVAFCPDDAIRINGGKTLFAYNVFEVTGGTGGDAVNIKAATTGDFAYNLGYNLATNMLKSADTGPGARGFCETNFYNNTIIASGYRRAEPGRGAGLNYESNAFGKCYNNLQVNTRFGLRLVAGEDVPNMDLMEYGHNWYYGAVQTVTDEFYPSDATSSVGLIGNNPIAPIPDSDVAGAPQENDPLFVNFDPSNFTFSGNSTISTDPLAANIQPMPAGADFHLSPNSPALTGGKTDIEPVHQSYVTLDGAHTFFPPAPSEFFGALGSN